MASLSLEVHTEFTVAIRPPDQVLPPSVMFLDEDAEEAGIRCVVWDLPDGRRVVFAVDREIAAGLASALTGGLTVPGGLILPNGG